MQETSVDRSTVLELLCSLVDTDPRRELVSDGVRRMSREQVLDEGLAVGRFLRSCGVAPDDGVVVILPNWAEFIAVRVAICACRSVIVPLVGNVQPDTLRVTLGEVRPACLITYGQEHYDMARNLGFTGPVLVVRGSVAGDAQTFAYEQAVAGCAGLHTALDPLAPLPLGAAKSHAEGLSSDLTTWMEPSTHPWPHNTSCIIYTSGSTGKPKGVMHDANAHLLPARWQAEALQVGPDDVYYVPMSFGHIFGMGPGLLVPLISGGRLVFMDHYRSQTSCERIVSEGCTVYFGVPTMYIRDYKTAEEHGYDLSCLRTGIIAGDITSPDIIERYEKRFGTRLLSSYGMTETSSAVTCARYDDPEEIRYHSAGLPCDGVKVWIVGPHGEELPAGVTGQIACATPGLMTGYVNEPERTARQFDAQGRFLTGDLGQLTEQGALRVVGRLKDMIIRGGMNIYPVEVESVYNGRDDIAETRLLGYPDEELGQRTCLFVAPGEGLVDSPKELREFAYGKIERCKVPDTVLVIDQMPRTSNGKIDLKALRQRMEGADLKH